MRSNWCYDLQQKEKLIKKNKLKGFGGEKLHNEYFTLDQSLRDSDREMHYWYLRMSKERFDHLLSLVREEITKKDTKMREAISAEERLVMTLR